MPMDKARSSVEEKSAIASEKRKLALRLLTHGDTVRLRAKITPAIASDTAVIFISSYGGALTAEVDKPLPS